MTDGSMAQWINVMQGEVAHATPSQADSMVSTDATTCNIVALITHFISAAQRQVGFFLRYCTISV
jgi:hypothetical protein